jgi:hypothetical protein
MSPRRGGTRYLRPPQNSFGVVVGSASVFDCDGVGCGAKGFVAQSHLSELPEPIMTRAQTEFTVHFVPQAGR